jgi:aminopeptidase N
MRPFPRWILAVAALAAGCAVSAPLPRIVAPPLHEHGLPPTAIDVAHYAIALVLDPPARSIDAATRVEFLARRGVEEVELDLVGLAVSAVEDGDGRPLAFTHADGRLAIRLAAPLRAGEAGAVLVRYHGAPNVGLWFSGDDGAGNPTQAFTQGQAVDSRAWFPCVDHPSDRVTSEVTVTAPAAWTVVAAGERVASTQEGGQRTETWRMDRSHPCYLITLVAGEYERVEDAWRGRPLWYLVEAELAPYLGTVRDVTPRMLDHLSELTGLEYPYGKYSQAWVANFPWGGMENVTATTLTPSALSDERGLRDADSVDLYVHEAAHQWFGDLITCVDWSHAWLNEGLATYCEVLWTEHTAGPAAARALNRRHQETWLAHALTELQPAVSGRYREPDDLFDEDIYEGASARIDQLRFVLGDDAFFTGLREHVAQHADLCVDTDDLRGVFEAASGERLGWFFEQWFLRPGFPELDVDWEWDADRGVVVLTVAQVQERAGGVPEVYRAPVDVEVRDAEGVAIHRVELDERVERFELPARGEPVYVRFDHGSRLPKVVRWHKPPAEWIAMLEASSDPTGRADAARALGRLAAEPGASTEARQRCTAALAPALRGDADPWVRAAAAASLGAARGDGARAALMEAADTDPAAEVRAAALGALSAYGPDRDLAAFADAVFAEGYSYATMAAAALLYARARPAGAFDFVAERLALESPNDLLRERLLGVMPWIDDGRAYAECRRWAADRGTHQRARAAAVRQLAALGEKPIETARFLGQLFEEPLYHLDTACIEGLARLSNPESRRILRAAYARTQDAGQRRMIEEGLAPAP